MIDQLLEWHLHYNHYPPHSTALVPVAQRAIELAQDAIDSGDSWDVWGEHIELPEGIEFQDRTYVTVKEAVEAFHLDAFINSDWG